LYLLYGGRRIQLRGKKKTIIILFCLFCAISVSSIIRANFYIRESSDYIEVCSKGIVHVPKDVKYVKCNGVVRKVLGFVEVLPDEMEDCRCPKCCEGECYVIVIKDPEPDQEFDSPQYAFIQTEKSYKKADTKGIYYLWITC
jgi:hypothetical protein